MSAVRIIFVALLFMHSSLFAAVIEEDLTAEAKREGEIIYYSVVSAAAEVPIIRAFNKKYPFLKFNHYRAGQSALVERVLQEARTGRYPDVVTNNFFQLLIFVDKNVLEPYDFPERKSVRKEFVDPEGRFAAIGITPFSVAYETRRVKPADLPREYKGFLDAKWKGELGLVPQVGWALSMIDAMGEKDGEVFLRNLAKHNVRINSGNSLQLQLLAAGEFKVGISNIAYLVSRLKSQGAPVDFAYIDPVYADFTATGLVGKGPHKAAGKLFLRYLFSEEAQELYRDTGRVVGRVDVPPTDPRVMQGVKLHPYKASWAKSFDKTQKLVDSLFGRAK
jgi:iron(III) transport system substrate-binding protein